MYILKYNYVQKEVGEQVGNNVAISPNGASFEWVGSRSHLVEVVNGSRDDVNRETGKKRKERQNESARTRKNIPVSLLIPYHPIAAIIARLDCVRHFVCRCVTRKCPLISHLSSVQPPPVCGLCAAMSQSILATANKTKM